MCYLCLVLQRQGWEEGKKNKEERNNNAGKLSIIVEKNNFRRGEKKLPIGFPKFGLLFSKSMNSVKLAELQHT